MTNRLTMYGDKPERAELGTIQNGPKLKKRFKIALVWPKGCLSILYHLHNRDV